MEPDDDWLPMMTMSYQLSVAPAHRSDSIDSGASSYDRNALVADRIDQDIVGRCSLATNVELGSY